MLLDSIDWFEQWVEAVSLLFVVIGFVISILFQSAILSYASIVLAGMVAGRIFYIKRYKEPILPFVLMILGFLVGYLLGSFWVSRFWILVFFALSFTISYQLHLRKILVIFKSREFIK